MTIIASTRRVRLPVGSLVPIAPPGSGKSTLLRSALLAAGLPESHIVSRDELRIKHGNRCPDLAHRAVPSSCLHAEDAVDAEAATHRTTFLAVGQTWLYDQTGLDEARLTTEVAAAHERGLAAVALRRRSNDGATNVPLAQLSRYNAARDRRVPQAVLDVQYARYEQLTAERLTQLGFDVVVEWDEHTVFELMPSGTDGPGITGPFAVVGDIHGCHDTFTTRLLPTLGTDEHLSNPDLVVVSVGDVHDKGQHSVAAIRWWLWAVRTGRALLVDSNHSKKLVSALARPGSVRIGHALAVTLAEIDAQPDADELKEAIVTVFGRLPNHLVLPGVVVAHAAMTSDRLHKTDSSTRHFALYTRNSRDPWTWDGTQTLVHGHCITATGPERRRGPARPDGTLPGEIVNVDTGAYERGGLTAWLSQTGQTVTVPTVETDAMDAAENDKLRRSLVERGLMSPVEYEQLVAADALRANAPAWAEPEHELELAHTAAH